MARPRPTITAGQAKGFARWASRTTLSASGAEVLQFAKTNLRELAC
jgi:hypothetical protein